MAKEKSLKQNSAKKPAVMNLKEKRAAKKNKIAEKNKPSIIL